MQPYRFAFHDFTRPSWSGSGHVAKTNTVLSKLFSPLKLRDVTFKNRVFVSPMCMFSSEDGLFNDWHLVHLGSMAAGGAGLVFTEATAVSPEGRISPWDTGLWKDEQIPVLARIVSFIHANRSHACIQASIQPPFFERARENAGTDLGGWQPVGPSPVAYDEKGFIVPHELTVAEIARIQQDFVNAAIRADRAGFDVVEIHGAHGYLIGSFNSPFANKRTDEYGGSFEKRIRFCIETVTKVRAAWPAHKPLFLRLSCTDWVAGGWSLADSVELAKRVKELGVDLFGAEDARQQIVVGPGYQVPFAERIKREAGIVTGAVGLITDAHQAEEILTSGKADAVLLGRELLRNPRWPLDAARELGVTVDWPLQYERAAHPPKPVH